MRKDLVEWWVEYDPGNRRIRAIRPQNPCSNSIHEVRICQQHPRYASVA